MAPQPLDNARIDELFAAVLEQPPERRHEFLAEACFRPEDRDLRRAVEELLRLSDDAALDGELAALADGRLVRDLARSVESEADAGEGDPEPHDRIGDYRVVERLGRGGMGVVLLAERVEGEFAQRVAIKLLRRELGGEASRRRFDEERTILASLSHPHIARLYGGGTTPGGRPFFTMEYVPGRPIDRYSDENRLSVERRLELFEKVVRAVDYAHRNLVVHRDIKPSNILVGTDGQPKLLDFGIARLVDPRAAAEPATRLLDRRLTPEYASPELLRGEVVATASDIYQLGLVLYRLLTGRPAQEARSGSRPSAGEWERLVCHEEPTRPSAAVSGEAAVAAARRSTPARLRRTLAGDLDNIVRKALAKEPERRYASAGDLARDLERHRADLPVTARPPELSYRARKFARRHRAAVAGAALALLALVAGLVATAWQGTIARRERDRARVEAATAARVTDFLIDLFAVADPSESRGRTLTAEEILGHGVERIDQSLSAEPRVRARLLDALGRVHQSLGSHDRAEELLGRALVVKRQTWGDDHPEVIDSQAALGGLLVDRRENERAEVIFRETLAADRRAANSDGATRARLERGLGRALYGRGQLGEAEAALRRTLAIEATTPEIPNRERASTRAELAVILHASGEIEGAEPLYRRALEIYREELGDDHPDTLTVLGNLASLLRMRGDLEAAEPLLRRSLEARRRIFGDEHEKVAAAAGNLGLLLSERGAHEEAESLNRETLAIRQKIYGPEAPTLTMSWVNVGYVLHEKGDLEAAIEAYATAERLGRLGDPEHVQLGVASFWHGKALAAAERHAEAIPRLGRGLEIYEAAYGAADAWSLDARVALGESLGALGRFGEAEEVLLPAEELVQPGSEQAAAALSALATLNERAGRRDRAARYRELATQSAAPAQPETE